MVLLVMCPRWDVFINFFINKRGLPRLFSVRMLVTEQCPVPKLHVHAKDCHYFSTVIVPICIKKTRKHRLALSSFDVPFPRRTVFVHSGRST